MRLQKEDKDTTRMIIHLPGQGSAMTAMIHHREEDWGLILTNHHQEPNGENLKTLPLVHPEKIDMIVMNRHLGGGRKTQILTVHLRGEREMTLILTNHLLEEIDRMLILTNHLQGEKDRILTNHLQGEKDTMLILTNHLQEEKDRIPILTNHLREGEKLGEGILIPLLPEKTKRQRQQKLSLVQKLACLLLERWNMKQKE